MDTSGIVLASSLSLSSSAVTAAFCASKKSFSLARKFLSSAARRRQTSEPHAPASSRKSIASRRLLYAVTFSNHAPISGRSNSLLLTNPTKKLSLVF